MSQKKSAAHSTSKYALCGRFLEVINIIVYHLSNIDSANVVGTGTALSRHWGMR